MKKIINEESSENKYLLYKELYQLRIMKKNPCFLYDFGTYLSNENKLNFGAVVLVEASQLIQDYNLELSLGDIYDKKGDYLMAERHYLAASGMCPNRFTPLFFLFKMYEKMKMNEKATHMAHIINEKKIKVNSVSVNYIKFEVRKYISENHKEDKEQIRSY